MPDIVTVNDKLKIIHVESKGNPDIEDLKLSLGLIVKCSEETGYTNVLVDARAVLSLPSAFSIYEFSSIIASRTKGLRIAIEVSKNTEERVRFIETVSRNQGANLKTFDMKDEAMDWLNKDRS